MAAIFQLRRGSGSVSLVDGELYLHKSSGSIQFSLGDDNPILLARLDQINSGSLNLSGNVTASNAYFSGDVAISGNLYLGNAPTDNISTLGQFTTNLVPNPNNGIDIGTPTAIWKTIYASTFSGSLEGDVVGLGNPTLFSASVDNRLDQLELASSSLQLFTSSQESKNNVIENYTSSMNSFTSSQEAKDVTISSYTSSMNSFTSSTNSRLGEIELYTSSLKSAIDVADGNTRIKGNLIVDGTQTSLNTTETFIEDKSITLASGSTTSAIADGAGLNIAGANVSMSWDDNNTRLYFNTNIAALGSISSSTIVGLNNVSVEVYSTSVDSRFHNLETTSASVNAHIDNINNWTASNGNAQLNQYTASATIRLNNLESTSASVNTQIADINVKTGSYETKFDTIGNVTSSINSFTSSQETKNSALEIVTSSLNTFSASMNYFSSSIFTNFSNSFDAISESFDYRITILDPGNLSAAIVAINTFTQSADGRLDSIESYTSSLKNAITVSGTDVSIAGGLTVMGTTTIIDSTTVNIKDNIIQLNGAGSANAGLVVRDATGTTTSGSLLWDTTNDYWIAGPLGAESKLLRAGGDGVISSSAQISSVFEEKASAAHTIVSGSSQITFSGISSLPTLVSGSSQINFTQLSGISSGIVSSSAQVTTLLPTGVVSGSSQLTSLLPTGVVSGSSQVSYIGLSNIPAGIVSGSSQLSSVFEEKASATHILVSGSSQITLSSTTGGGTSANVQFGSLGIGTTASGTSGEIRATGDITAYYSSDIRLKENIIPIPNALEKVNQISGNTYDWKEGYDEVHSHKGNDVGVIAQEIEQILPQIVTNRDTGFKAVQYEKIIPLLIEAIKELSSKVDRLENK